MKTLRESLEEWTDWDVAEYHLGAAVGLWPEWPAGEAWVTAYKGIVWSNTPVGNMLHATLKQLVALGTLEYDEEEQRYRASPTWKVSEDGT